MGNDKNKGNGPRKLNRKEMEETKGGFAGTIRTVKINPNLVSANAGRDLTVKPGGGSLPGGGINQGAADTTW